jgi:type VI secretion system secreted protein Hcp
MAVDMFLKIDGIEGEATDSKHKAEIEVHSFSWGVSNSGSSAHGTGAGSGKANVQDFSFSMTMNKASPKLFLACTTGQHIAKAVFTARKAGGGNKPGQEYLIFTFSDVLISSYQTGAAGGSGELPTESISFNFSKVQQSYAPQKADGTLDAPVQKTYDIKQAVAS